ncbi:OsmC family protein [Klebsiella aerogenes]
MESNVAKYEMVTTWRGGMASRTHCCSCTVGGHLQNVRDHMIDSDEPEALGGAGQAPNPQELMMAAFNACMTAAFVHEACRLKVTVTNLEIHSTGQLHTGLQEAVIKEMDEWLHYTIHVSGKGSINDFERIHLGVINSSPNRWLLAQNMLIEGDLVVL